MNLEMLKHVLSCWEQRPRATKAGQQLIDQCDYDYCASQLRRVIENIEATDVEPCGWVAIFRWAPGNGGGMTPDHPRWGSWAAFQNNHDVPIKELVTRCTYTPTFIRPVYDTEVQFTYFVSGPTGHFYADTSSDAETVLKAMGVDRDDWTVTKIHKAEMR